VTPRRPGGRALAVDLGTRRVGLAVSDSSGALAFPFDVFERSADPAGDAAQISRALEQTGATTVVVGLPLSLDGSSGPAATGAREWAERLTELLGAVEVVLFDERLTTVSANAGLAAAGRRGRSARARVDSAAATVLLQSWLDAGEPR
jgi:putative Holliday junction resolvase